ncbi:MAG: DUF11 domain-containing protein, partial [Desulfobulbaceae bacterium]|nr:DUF11 domain-containing protein [Desulfobulbaceae bacterium]
MIPNPTVSHTSPNATGSLSYQPVANQFGTAHVTVTVRDAGLDGILGDADDATFGRSFTVVVNQVIPPPNLTINDVSLNEGNAGTTTFTFTVSLSAPAGPGGVTFDIATADNTATQLSDYTTKTLTGQTIPAGSSTYSFSVLVNGDTTFEANETFLVNVTNVTNAVISDGQGQGAIVNDDLPQADLAITKTDGVTTATPGGSTMYTITASNAGPNDASGATVSDTFPATLTCSWTCVGAGGGTCTAAGAGNISDTTNLPS